MKVEQCWCNGAQKESVITLNPYTNKEIFQTRLCSCVRSEMANDTNPTLAGTGGHFISERLFPFTVRRNLLITGTPLIDFLLQLKHYAMTRVSSLEVVPIYHSIEILTKHYLGDGLRLVDLFRTKLLVLLFDCSQKNDQLSNCILEVVSGRSSVQPDKTGCLYSTWIYCPKPLDSCEWEYSSELGEIIKNKFYSLTLESSGIHSENKVKARAETFTV